MPHPHPQELWATLAANRLNIVPALNFLIDRGLKEDVAGADAAAVAATGKEVRECRACCVLACSEGRRLAGKQHCHIQTFGLAEGRHPCLIIY